MRRDLFIDVIAGALLLSALPAFAASASNTIDFMKQDGDQMARLEDASRTVREQPQIQSMLQQRKVHSLSIAQKVTASDLETTKFQHYYKGLEVVGSMAFHVRSQKGNEVVDHLARFDLETRPSVTEDQAIAIARSVAGDRDVQSKPELKILPSHKNSARLVYWVNLDAKDGDGSREVIIDAQSGKVIGNLSKDLTIAPIEIRTADHQGLALQLQARQGMGGHPTLAGCRLIDLATGKMEYHQASECRTLAKTAMSQAKCQMVLQGSPVAVDPGTCQEGQRSDDVASQAASNSEAVLQYYATHHHRDSYDDHGGTAVSVVHAGLKYCNAHWSVDQNIMVYGDGDPAKGMTNFTRALDVAGHEMTHGVTEHTAKLTAMGQSGALNEANSDFFGIMIAGAKDWAIGKALFVDQSQGEAIRDLANPATLSYPFPRQDGTFEKRPYPAHIKDMIPTGESDAIDSESTCDSSNDNCWVHENATIPGHASYLVTQAIGPDKAEHLYYAVLTQLLSPSDTIASAAESTKKICDKLYDSQTCSGVRQAYAQVGL